MFGIFFQPFLILQENIVLKKQLNFLQSWS